MKMIKCILELKYTHRTCLQKLRILIYGDSNNIFDKSKQIGKIPSHFLKTARYCQQNFCPLALALLHYLVLLLRTFIFCITSCPAFGLKWLCSVSPALNNPTQGPKNSFCFGWRLIPKKTERQN